MTTVATPVDVYYKKRIPYTCRGQTFAFDVAHTLFSSYQVDEGTDLFLRTIAPDSPQTILDLGCGCGVIGIVLARWFPQARVILADRDLLAVRYARHNAVLNQVPNVEVIGSVGFEHIPALPFDLSSPISRQKLVMRPSNASSFSIRSTISVPAATTGLWWSADSTA